MLPDLVFTRRGSGTPLVLLHGIGHRREAWDPIIDRLSEHFDVIAPDLSGFGQSPAFAGQVRYTMENASDHLSDQFAVWGITKPHVVGNSLGGAISLELGSRGLVSSVTALSPAGFFGHVGRVQALVPLFLLRISALVTPEPMLRYLADRAWGRRLIGWILYTHPERHDAAETYGDSMALKHATAFERTAMAGVRYSFDRQVPVPTTIAWGKKDRILPYVQSRTARERLPQARHVDLPNCGHVPMADDPDLIVRIIEETVRAAEESKAA
ncbi:MAG TPA: alpha/beta hydrolase [Acidimicrobiia bacterium]|nr:alpha/beta hydrolase [Acidimicrobiia bacterium]